MRIPELLAPAGNMEALRTALHFGADAVYGGMKKFGLRAFAGNFDPDGLNEAVSLVHRAGKKFYRRIVFVHIILVKRADAGDRAGLDVVDITAVLPHTQTIR